MWLCLLLQLFYGLATCRNTDKLSKMRHKNGIIGPLLTSSQVVQINVHKTIPWFKVFSRVLGPTATIWEWKNSVLVPLKKGRLARLWQVCLKHPCTKWMTKYSALRETQNLPIMNKRLIGLQRACVRARFAVQIQMKISNTAFPKIAKVFTINVLWILLSSNIKVLKNKSLIRQHTNL